MPDVTALSPRMRDEAKALLEDSTAPESMRAAAIMLLVGDVSSFPEIQQAAERLQLARPYEKLAGALARLTSSNGNLWVLRQGEAEACRDNLARRIRAKAKVWIVHGGRSQVWKDVMLYVERNLKLDCVEFNDPGASRITIVDRVKEMVYGAHVAVAIMSAEEALAEGGIRRARQNVIHEIGLAQGHLGFDRVIIMQERGVEPFTNMDGLVYVPFASDNLPAAYDDLRQHIEARLF